MADGFDIHLNEERAAKVRAAADAAGVDATEMVMQIVDMIIGQDLTEDLDGLADYDRTGEFITREDWMAGLRDEVLVNRTA